MTDPCQAPAGQLSATALRFAGLLCPIPYTAASTRSSVYRNTTRLLLLAAQSCVIRTGVDSNAAAIVRLKPNLAMHDLVTMQRILLTCRTHIKSSILEHVLVAMAVLLQPWSWRMVGHNQCRNMFHTAKQTLQLRQQQGKVWSSHAVLHGCLILFFMPEGPDVLW